MIYQNSELLCAKPIASVFVFTFNQEVFVKQTIESILLQKCNFNYEIVICDDCSNDSTLSVCLDYLKIHPNIVRVVSNNENIGLRSSFFKNIANYARGQYIAICAGDDWWIDSYKLNKQVYFLQNNAEYGLVHTYARVYDDSKNILTKSIIGSNKNSFEENLMSNRVAALTMCFTLESFLKYIKEVDPISLPYSEDYPMVLWYSYRSKIHFIGDVTCAYRYLVNSASHTANIDRIYQGPKDFYECGLFFRNFFNYSNNKITELSQLRYYLDRMRYSYLLKDEYFILEMNKFLKDNNYYLFYLLSLLYRISGTSTSINNIVFTIGRVLRRFHSSRKYFV